MKTRHRKIIAPLLLCMLGFALSSHAAYQHGDYVAFSETPGSLLVVKAGQLSLNFLDIRHMNSIGDWSSLTVRATNPDGVVSDRTVTITGNVVDIGNFNAGDTLAFFVSDGVNTTSGFQLWGTGWDTQAMTYDSLVFGGNYGPNDSSFASFPFQVGGAPASGQPLPGVVFSLLLGGACGALLLKRQKRHSAEAEH